MTVVSEVQTSWLQKGQQSADTAVNGITALSNNLASNLPEMPSQLPAMPTTSLYNAFGVHTSLLASLGMVMAAGNLSWRIAIAAGLYEWPL